MVLFEEKDKQNPNRTIFVIHVTFSKFFIFQGEIIIYNLFENQISRKELYCLFLFFSVLLHKGDNNVLLHQRVKTQIMKNEVFNFLSNRKQNY